MMSKKATAYVCMRFFCIVIKQDDSGVTIPAGTQLHYWSGTVPSKDAEGNYGDTKAQTESVLN